MRTPTPSGFPSPSRRRRAWLLLALSGALAEDGHRSVNLLATTAVRGAAFPTNQWGAECDTETYNSTPCSCYGGAARRRTFLSAGMVLRRKALAKKYRVKTPAWWHSGNEYFVVGNHSGT